MLHKDANVKEKDGHSPSTLHVSIDPNSQQYKNIPHEDDYSYTKSRRRAKTERHKQAIPTQTLASALSGGIKEPPRPNQVYEYDIELTQGNTIDSSDQPASPPPATDEENQREKVPPKSQYQASLKILRKGGVLLDANPTIANAKSNDLVWTIVDEFNKYVKTDKNAYVSSRNPFSSFWTTIERLNPNEVMLATRNGVPEIFGYQPEQLVKNTRWLNPTITIEKIRIFDLSTTAYFGHGRTHYVRVDPGHFGLGTLDNFPVILNAGIHVIHALFEYQKQVRQDTVHIQNGAINIVRVPPGQLALFRMGDKYMMHDGGTVPYVCIEDNFKFIGTALSSRKLVSIADYYHRINPHQNEVVIISDNGAVQTLETVKDKKLTFIEKPSVEVLAFVSLDKKNIPLPRGKDGVEVPYVYPFKGKLIEVHVNIIYQVTDIQKFIELNLVLKAHLDNVLDYVENLTLTELGKIMLPAKTEYSDFDLITSVLKQTIQEKLAAGGIELQELSLRRQIANNKHFKLKPITPNSRNQQAFFMTNPGAMKPLVPSKSDSQLNGAAVNSTASTENSDNSRPSSVKSLSHSG